MNSLLRGRMSNARVTSRVLQRSCSLKFHRASPVADSVSSAVDDRDRFAVPYRIERSPTDILRALEKTISRDPGAPHYKYMDDPYLSPLSNRSKRVYALAKESGRKAAAWIQSEYVELFNQKLAEPEVKAFLPKARYNAKEEVSEQLLMAVIKEGSVTDALNIYHLLEKDASVESKQALLELLCYFNSQEQLSEIYIEERWYRKAVDRQRQIWRNNPEVEELFEFLKKQDEPIAAAAYNAMICGTAKYMKVDRAWELFMECTNKNIPLNLETYNQLIHLVKILKDGTKERKSTMMDLLKRIQGAGLEPNIGTLNSALRVAAALNERKAGMDLACSLITEFRSIGVEPSLASYYFALIIHCKDRGPRSPVLYEIMDALEGTTLTMQDPSDTFFFVTAMDVACNHLGDYQLAERIHKFLLKDNNYDFIGEAFKESIYYRHYTTIAVRSLPFERFMTLYELMVPNLYIPEPSVMEGIVDAVEQTDVELARKFLPRLWSQMIMFEHLERQKLEQTELRSRNAEWSSAILADAAILLAKANEFDRFLEVLTVLIHKQSSLIGTMHTEQTMTIFEVCLEMAHAAAALDVLKYSVEAGYEESIVMGGRIRDNISLSSEQETLLVNLVGSELSQVARTSETASAE